MAMGHTSCDGDNLFKRQVAEAGKQSHDNSKYVRTYVCITVMFTCFGTVSLLCAVSEGRVIK